MRIFVSVLTIAILLTTLVVLGFYNGRGTPGNIAFPGETKSVKIPTRYEYLGGCVAAKGAGEFFITSVGFLFRFSFPKDLHPRSKWYAYGVDKVQWTYFKFRPGGKKDRKGKLRCEVRIPFVNLKESTWVKGYLYVPAIIPVQTGRYTFHNRQAYVKSEEFRLWLYPLETKKYTQIYATFRFLAPFAIIAWSLLFGLYAIARVSKKESPPEPSKTD